MLCIGFQFIQQSIRRDFVNIEEVLTPPEGQDEGVWKYEHLRYEEVVAVAVEVNVIKTHGYVAPFFTE